MAGLAGSRHLDAVDAQLGREIPQHVGLLQAGLVVQRVSHRGEVSETWGGWSVVKEEGGPGREKSPLAKQKPVQTVSLVTNQNLFCTKAGRNNESLLNASSALSFGILGFDC